MKRHTTVAASSVAALTLTSIVAAGTCVPMWNVDPGVPGIPNEAVNGMATYNDGTRLKLYVVGDFTSAGGAANTANIAAWNGAAWESVGGGLGGGQFTNCLKVYDGELYAGGYFSDAGGVAGTAKLAKWDGSAWSSIGAQLDSFVNSVWGLETWDDGNGEALYIAGNYVNIGGNLGFDHITKWDGQNFSQVGGGTITGSGIPLIVFSIAIWDDGNGEALYIGGRFDHVAGVPANRIAKWDGTQWSALGTGLSGGIATAPYDMVPFNGSLYVAGQQIDSAGGVPVTDVARWDGSQWHEAGDSLEGTVWDLAVYDDGNGPALYAIGLFTQSGGGNLINHVARLDNGQWVDAGSGINANCYSALVTPYGINQALYVGGSFTQAAGGTCNRVTRINCPCPADLIGIEGQVDVFDLFVLLNNWGTAGAGADLAMPNNVVDVFDLFALLNDWGLCD